MIALELFCCSGGMAEGFRRAGIDFSLAFDASPDACESYAANLGHRPVQMDVRDLLRMVRAGWSPGPIDLLVADPPCTPWSRAGKRQGTEDPRDMLRDTCELIERLRPRCYVIGNVPGLDDSTNLHVVQRWIGGLARHGYCVADYARLDAADYGVPQRRIRPFWFGHLSGRCLRWPEPTHADPRKIRPVLPGIPERKPWVTCREALGHLPLEDLGKPVRLRRRGAQSADPRRTGQGPRASGPDVPAGVVTCGQNGDGNVLLLNDKHEPTHMDRPAKSVASSQPGNGGAILVLNKKHPPSILDAPSMTICARDRGGAQGGGVVLLDREPDPNRPPAQPDAPHRSVTTVRDQALLAWPWDRPATTVNTRGALPPPGHHDQWSILSMPDAVVLSERAAAILQGFPDGWCFAGGTKRARWQQIGQAMPPALAEAVARSVRAQMEASA